MLSICINIKSKFGKASKYPPHFRKLFFVIFLFSLIYTCIEIGLSDSFWDIKNLIHFLPPIMIVFIYKTGLFYNPIEFDEQFYYMNNKEKKVPLSSIQSVKLTSVANYTNQHYWKITYVLEKTESFITLPSLIDSNFSDFIDAVRKANPSVDVDEFRFKLYFGFIPFTSYKPKSNV